MIKKLKTPQSLLRRFKLRVGKSKKEHFVLRNTSLRFIFSERFVLRIIDTIRLYLEYMEDAFVLERATRYDIKGRKYIDSPYKYYFEDLGLRNARLGFRQVEPTHIMENMLYNELRAVGMKVDVGQVFTEVKGEDGTRRRKTLEVDFVCNRGYERVYIQSAYAMETEEKRNQELASLRKLRDGFRRIVIVNGLQPTYMNEEGVYIVNIMDFLRDPEKYMEERV